MIDENKLIEFANNHVDKKIDANDIARFTKENVLVPPVNIGDKLYRPGHGNRKYPEEWSVYYLGYNGQYWEISVSLYHGQDYIQSLRITEDQIGKLFFKYYDECQIEINKRHSLEENNE